LEHSSSGQLNTILDPAQVVYLSWKINHVSPEVGKYWPLLFGRKNIKCERKKRENFKEKEERGKIKGNVS
jgi:hypothetical protein